MKQYGLEIVQNVARVMAQSFMEDPLNTEIFSGVQNKDELLEAHSLIHTKHAVNGGNLQLLDGNPNAFFVGFDSKEENKFGDMILHLRILIKTFQMLNFNDIKRIIANNKKVKNVLSFDWHKEYINGRHYRVKIIAIDREQRGTGAFRKLITPAISYSETNNIPMVLETHNPLNVGLYEHFGFQLVKMISDKDVNVQQYCMIRYPVKDNHW